MWGKTQLSVEKMVNWTHSSVHEISKMDAIPESINDLVALIANRAAEPQDRLLRAVSVLGDKLARDGRQPLAQAGVQALVDCIRTERDIRLVTHCISVLSRIRNEEAVPAVIDVLLATHITLYDNPQPADFVDGDDSMRLRCAAATALGKLGDNRAIIPLMSILNDKTQNYRLRLQAAESLGKLGDDHAVKPLIDILSDEREKSVYLKESVAKALGMLGDIRAIEPLIEVLESKRGIRDKFNFLKEQVIEAIGRIGKPDRKAADTLVLALYDDAPSIRLAAVEALSAIGDPDCLEALSKRVFDEDDDVAKAAAYAVYHIGGEPAIRELLTHDNLPMFIKEELESYIP